MYIISVAIHSYFLTQDILYNVEVKLCEVDSKVMEHGQNIKDLEKKVEVLMKKLDDFQHDLMVIVNVHTEHYS